MKRFVYIITNNSKGIGASLLPGLASNMVKTMKFYRDMPSINPDKKLQCLVYLEEFRGEEAAAQRFRELAKLTRAQKETLINSVNPEWVDITPQLT